jgi:hypothetical protein
MCPLYVSGPMGLGDRKSIPPAERLALGEYDQLHHFIADPRIHGECLSLGSKPSPKP